MKWTVGKMERKNHQFTTFSYIYFCRPTGSVLPNIVGSMECIWRVFHRRKRMTDLKNIFEITVSIFSVEFARINFHLKTLGTIYFSSLSCRSRQWTFLDFRYRFSRGRKFLLDGEWSSYHIYKLECRRAKQFPLWEWRGRELPWALESRWQRTQMERLTLFVWNIFCLWSAIRAED